MVDFQDDAQSFADKLTTLLGDHRRFVAEFEGSLSNAGQFIALADRSMEHEPEDTASMLAQILEIDLLGHVHKLSEEFQSVRGFLTSSLFEDEAGSYDEEMSSIEERYEALEQEAAQQVERIEAVLRVLETR